MPARHFMLARLIPGERYDGSIKLDEHTSRRVINAKPVAPEPTDLGDIKADPNPTKPYVPPTPSEKAAKAFANRDKPTTKQRLQKVLAAAQHEYTQPLVLFGTPGDPAVVELFRLFEERPKENEKAAESKAKTPHDLRWEFELLSLDDSDEGIRDLAAQLGVSRAKGQSVLAVLNDAGALAATYPLSLTNGNLDVVTLTQFLAAHKLTTRDAEKMLADGLRRAAAEDKRLFFTFAASWCGPCRSLTAFIAKHQATFDANYIFVKLDISRDDHASELRDKYKQAQTGGVPWFTILDAAGKSLITSNDPEADPADRFGNSNIGFPSEPSAIKHFLNMLKTTAPRLTDADLAILRADLLKSD